MATLPIVGSLDWKSVLVGVVLIWFVVPYLRSKMTRVTAAKDK